MHQIGPTSGLSRGAILATVVVLASLLAAAGTSAKMVEAKKAKLPIVTVSPKKLNFGEVSAGATSAPQTVRLSNKGSVSIAAPEVSTSPSAFVLDTNGCTAEVPAGGSCQVTVAFAPPTKGNFKNGVLSFKDAGAKSPQKVTLSGIGSGPFTALTAKMTTGRAGHTATLLADGQVLLTGGTISHGQNGSVLDTAEVYDPVANTFTALTAAMTAARFNHTATMLPNGLVLLTGGFTNNSTGIPLDTAEVYDPVANTFTALAATMTSVRAEHTATLLPNGLVLLTGGTDESAALNTAEVYDPVANTFTALAATMTTVRVGHTATLLPNGQVLLTGGGDKSGALNTAEVYDPAAETFTALTATMTIARAFHTATPLPNGLVLLTGGAFGPSKTDLTILKTAEVYDPVANIFTALSATMTTARAQHTATLLPNGLVLLTGGGNRVTGRALKTAEVYSP